MKKYILIGLGILSISMFLIVTELKAATFTSLDKVAAEEEKEYDDNLGG